MCFIPVSEQRRGCVAILSQALGREVVVTKVTAAFVKGVIGPVTTEAFLTRGKDLILRCAMAELMIGKGHLASRGVYLDWDTYISSVYSLCWNPGKTSATRRRFTGYDPMRSSVLIWVRKCVREAIAEMLSDTHRRLENHSVRSWARLPTTSLAVLALGGFDATDPDSRDFRDSIEFDEPKTIQPEWIKLGFCGSASMEPEARSQFKVPVAAEPLKVQCAESVPGVKFFDRSSLRGRKRKRLRANSRLEITRLHDMKVGFAKRLLGGGSSIWGSGFYVWDLKNKTEAHLASLQAA